jgi:hypothetical protein
MYRFRVQGQSLPQQDDCSQITTSSKIKKKKKLLDDSCEQGRERRQTETGTIHIHATLKAEQNIPKVGSQRRSKKKKDLSPL